MATFTDAHCRDGVDGAEVFDKEKDSLKEGLATDLPLSKLVK